MKYYFFISVVKNKKLMKNWQVFKSKEEGKNYFCPPSDLNSLD